MSAKRRQLKYADRRKIAKRLREGVGVRAIAEEIGMAFTTIYREIRRGTDGVRDEEGCLVYDADKAEQDARQKRRNCALSGEKRRRAITGRGG